ncbi:MAG TPA: hypothetical protein DCL66_12060 [Gammaproteobacteria bacterium]|nr:hypothetical protein [Gammaproteobacteria bacterium]|tara:strand:- start:548 stop:1048 length:501 start_codon:yes stop_codon:yes gene_type:complete
MQKTRIIDLACKFRVAFKVGLFFCLSLILIDCSSEDIDWIDIPLPDSVFYDEQAEFRSDVIEIPVYALKDLEYTLNMKQGHAITYSWEAVGLNDPEKLLIEFHGHTIRETEAPGDLMFYKVGRSDSSSGYLVAPFEGIHGWYFSNETGEDINVILTVSGFYELEES